MAETNGYASAAQLFAATGKRRHKDVTLPVSGLTVRIQSLMEGEISDYQAAVLKSGRGGQIQYVRSRLLDANRRLIGMCLVDAAGKPLLAESDYGRIAQMDGADSQHLYDECAKHAGINRDDIEELAKNSAEMHASGSLTD